MRRYELWSSRGQMATWLPAQRPARRARSSGLVDAEKRSIARPSIMDDSRYSVRRRPPGHHGSGPVGPSGHESPRPLRRESARRKQEGATGFTMVFEFNVSELSFRTWIERLWYRARPKSGRLGSSGHKYATHSRRSRGLTPDPTPSAGAHDPTTS